MKILRLLFTAVLLVLASTSLYAKNYYVCDTGNDNNDGLSESKPFRSYVKAIVTFNKISAGDSVLLCRGGVFPVTSKKVIFNTKCKVESVCTLAAYGNPSDNKPIVLASGYNGISFGDGGKNYSDGGYVIKNLFLKSTKKPGVGLFLYNHVTNVTLSNLRIEGFVIGVQVADGGVNNIELNNSVIIRNKSQGWLGGCDNCLIENNTFENNGHGILDHNIYLSSPGHSIITDMKIKDNILYKSSMVDGKCRGVSLVSHGRSHNLVIENNIIKEDVGAVGPYCWGISIDPGYDSEEEFHDVVIRGNELHNVGNIGIGCASCNGAIIENNTIIDDASVLIYGIAVPVRTEDSMKSKNVQILNNMIKLSVGRAGTAGIFTGGENPVLVKYNTVILPANSQGDCFKAVDASKNINISSNTCNINKLSNLDVKAQVAEEQVQAAEEQAQASAAVRAAAVQAAEAQAAAAEAQAAAIQAQAVAQASAEQDREKAEAEAQKKAQEAAIAQAKAQMAEAAQATAQAKSATVTRSASNKTPDQTNPDATISTIDVLEQAQVDYTQNIRLGGSGSGSNSGWSRSSSKGSIVTYSDVVYATDNQGNSDPEDSGDCRASANGQCLLR